MRLCERGQSRRAAPLVVRTAGGGNTASPIARVGRGSHLIQAEEASAREEEADAILAIDLAVVHHERREDGGRQPCDERGWCAREVVKSEAVAKGEGDRGAAPCPQPLRSSSCEGWAQSPFVSTEFSNAL